MLDTFDGIPANMPFRFRQRHHFTGNEVQADGVMEFMGSAGKQLHAKAYPDNWPLLASLILQVMHKPALMQCPHRARIGSNAWQEQDVNFTQHFHFCADPHAKSDVAKRMCYGSMVAYTIIYYSNGAVLQNPTPTLNLRRICPEESISKRS